MQHQPRLTLAPQQQVNTGDQVLELLVGGIPEVLVGEQLRLALTGNTATTATPVTNSEIRLLQQAGTFQLEGNSSLTAEQNIAADNPSATGSILVGGTIDFTAVFTEYVTGFAAGDVTLVDTAGATVSVAEVAPNDGTTYNVAVSGMTTNGKMRVSIPANAATDAAGNGNTASTSADNTVTFTLNGPPTANPDSY